MCSYEINFECKSILFQQLPTNLPDYGFFKRISYEWRINPQTTRKCLTLLSIQLIYMLLLSVLLFYLLLPSTSNLLHRLFITFHREQISICCSFYGMGQVGPVNGMMTVGVNKPQSTPASSTASKSAKEYDFSSLTQGMFAKQ